MKQTIFAIATNDADAANEWSSGLDRLATEAGLKLTQGTRVAPYDEDSLVLQVVG